LRYSPKLIGFGCAMKFHGTPSSYRAARGPLYRLFFLYSKTNARWCPVSVRTGGHSVDLTAPTGFFIEYLKTIRIDQYYKFWGDNGVNAKLYLDEFY
jgi:hypothetical protein